MLKVHNLRLSRFRELSYKRWADWTTGRSKCGQDKVIMIVRIAVSKMAISIATSLKVQKTSKIGILIIKKPARVIILVIITT